MLIAQDDLNTLGFRTGGLDRNIWRQNRRSSKKLSKEQRGLPVDGIVGRNTWRSLQEDVVGTGRTSTTID